MKRLVAIALALAAFPALAGTFPDDWNRRCELVIPASAVPGALSDVEITLTEACLPAEIFTLAQADGGDLRFTSDEAGTAILNPLLVQWNTGSNIAEIHVGLVPSLSAVSDTSIWVWYDADEVETQPGGSPYRTTAKAVYTMDEDPSGTAPQITDRSGSSNSLTSNGSMTSGDVVTGVVGSAINFDGTDDYLLKDTFSAGLPTDSTVMLWWRTTGYTGTNTFNRYLFDLVDDYTAGVDGAKLSYGVDGTIGNGLMYSTGGGNTGAQSGPAINTWTHESVVWNQTDGDIHWYRNGSSFYNNTSYTDTSTANDLTIGSRPSGSGSALHHQGDIDEFRVYSEELSADYIGFRYNNENDPNATIVEGTPESVGTSIAPHVMYYQRLRNAA